MKGESTMKKNLCKKSKKIKEKAASNAERTWKSSWGHTKYDHALRNWKMYSIFSGIRRNY